MNKKAIITILLAMVAIASTAQSVRGRVIDELFQPMSFANVVLINRTDSTFIKGTVTKDDGTFTIQTEKNDGLLKVSCVGYKTRCIEVQKDSVGDIQMQPDTYNIKGIQVKGERIIVKAENGHLTYSLPQLLEILPADNAYEALTRIPGVMDNGDGLNFTGRSVTLIINGKPTTLSSEQVIERLKQMPASQLAKAEVLPSAPAKYHVRGMVINVITKDYIGTNQLQGQLQGFYRQNKYGYGQAKGNLIYQHGNFGLDASYAFGFGDAYGKIEHEAHHPLGDQRVDYSDRTVRTSSNINHNYRIGLDYAFSKDSRLNVAYTGKWTSNDATNTSTGLETSIQNSETHTYLHNVDASYTSPFGMQLSVSYTNYQNPRTQHLNSKLYDETRILTAESKQRISKWLFTADQTHELPNDWELNYGVETQFTENNSYQTTLNADGSELPDATSHVDYNERILNIYTGFSKQFSNAFSMEASVAAENYHATKWNDWRIYPSLSAMWNINENNLLNFTLSSETVYPTYWSTMSSIFYSSAYSEIWGNPDLKPHPSYELNLMWQLNHKYTFLAFAELKPDYFVQLAYQPSDRMAVIMKEDNWDYSNSGGLQVSAQYSAGKWLNGNVMGTMLFRHDKSTDFFDLPFNRTCLSAILGGTAVIRFSSRQNIQFIFNPLFQSKTIQGVYDIDPLFRLNASLRWTSDNKKWSVIVAGQNITNSRAITHSHLSNQDYTMRVWMEYPNVSLTAIYRIGKYKDKKTRPIDTSRMGY